MTAFSRIYDWLYPQRKRLVYAVYGLVAGCAYGAAFLLRFEFAVPADYAAAFLYTVPAVVAVRLVLAWVFKLSSGRWRFIGTGDILRLFLATTTGTTLLFLSRFVVPPELLIPRSVLLIEWVLTSYLTAGVWVAYRVGFEQIRHVRSGHNGNRKRALVVGAGEAGTLLAREIQRFPTGYRLIGFVDDDPHKWGARLYGVDVIGGSEDLDAIVVTEQIDEIILAVPSATPGDLRRLVQRCKATKVPFKVLPGIKEVLEGQIGLHHVRALQIEDLLGREPVDLQLPELAEDLTQRTVMITGAAGSIGSELARQVALHSPTSLILVDQAETALFYLQQELQDEHANVELVPIVQDVVDAAAVDDLFDRFQPDRVFHAAAYKHVPMMESNPEQAIRNNVLGTRVVADAAGRHGCEKFVLVSTDKAVEPANIMGATKRLAELVILEMQGKHPRTAFGAVRFGNVLGSSGSVLPIFRRQLANEKPLTVTHPDVTRYFMTIPEAVQLILQASLLDEFRGHIAMLEMGEPVRILDLAKNFLRLSGMRPKVGETIVFTGLRPGEKLHEELAAAGEEAVETRVSKVRMLRTCSHGKMQVLPLVERWEGAFANGHRSESVAELRSLFTGLAAVELGIVAELEAVSPAETLPGA